jgi:cytoskeletal protein CcmA (bactofilin family)
MVKNLPAVERSTKIRFGKNVPEAEDQAENTIVFNATNSQFSTPTSNAVYLSPVRNRTNYEDKQIVLLMYNRSTKEITESGEAATDIIQTSLQGATNFGNITSNNITFTGAAPSAQGVSFTTSNIVGLSNLFPEHTVSVGSNLYVDDSGRDVLVVSGNVSILGNLQVTGDTTVINTKNTSIRDAIVELGKDNTSGDTTLDLGILMHRPDALSNVIVGYREGTDEFAIAYTDSKPIDTTIVPKTDEDINVHVYGLTHVDANIYAHEDVLVDGNVYVSGNTSVTEELTVSGNVYADKDLEVMGNTYVDGNVVAYKDLLVSGNVYVSTNVSVTEELTVSGNVYADKDLEVIGNVYVSTNVSVTEELTVSGNVYADKDLEVMGNTYVDGNVVAYKDFTLTGNAYVSGNVEVTEALIVSANTHLKGDNVFITHTMDFLDPTTAIVTDQISNVQIRLGQLENVANTASNPLINQVLTYDQDNSEWSNAYPDQTIVQVKNTSGAPMTRGQAVHVTGSNGNNTFQIGLADASDPTKMPAIGIVYENIPINGQGAVVTFGRANGIDGISEFANGDTLYVASGTAGGLTNVKPYGVNLDLIQNVGVVVNNNSGVMFVTGIGRSNDIPNARIITDYNDMQYVYVNNENNDLKKITSNNLNIPLTTAVSSSSNSAANAVTLRGMSITSGDGFHGDLVVAGNVTVDTNTFKVDAEANRVGLGTTNPTQTLDVRGSISTDDYLIHNGDTNTKIGFSGDDTFVVNTSGTEQLKIDVNGNTYVTSNLSVDTNTLHVDSKTNRVGILTLTPGQPLDVRGAANVGTFTTTTGTVTDATHSTSKDTGVFVVTRGGLGVEANIHSTNVFAVSHIGVGTPDTSYNLDVRGTANVGALTTESISITDTTHSTSKDTGAFILTNGGLGVEANIHSTNVFAASHIGVGTSATTKAFDVRGAANVGTFTTTTGTVTDAIHSTSKDTGVLVVTRGGLGVEANIHSTNVFAVSHIAVGTSETSNTFDVRGTANVGALVATSTHISDSTPVESKTTGALQVTGGVGIQGDIHATHANLEDVEADSVTVTDDTPATNKTTGALQVTGGVGVQGDLYAADTSLDSVKPLNMSINTVPITDGSKKLVNSVITQDNGAVVINANVQISGNISVLGNTFTVTSNDLVITDRIITIANNNPVHDLDIGIIMEHPDYNIGLIHHGSTHVGGAPGHHLSIGYINEAYDADSITWQSDEHITANIWGHLITQNTVTVEYNDVYIVGGGLGIGIGDRGDGTPDANIHVVGNVFVTSNISTASNVLITGDAAATSKITGALQVTGGVGVQGDIYATNGNLSGDLVVDTNTLKVDSATNRVGILTASPEQTLDVAGSISTDDYLIHNGDTDTKIGFSADDTFIVNTNGTEQVKVGVDGNVYITSNLIVDTSTLVVDSVSNRVGIGKADPTVALDVAGATTIGGVTSVTDTTDATGSTDGALIVSGGVDVAKKAFIAGVTSVTNTTDATGSTDGALIVSGGVDVAKKAFIAGVTSVTNTTDATGSTDGALIVSGGVDVAKKAFIAGVTSVTNTTDATGSTDGALIVSGGVDVAKKAFIAGVTSVTNDTDADSTTTGALQVTGGISTQANLYVGKDTYVTSNLNVDTNTLHVDSVSNRVGIGKTDPTVPLDVSGATTISGVTSVTNSTDADSTTTGALTVTGGISTQTNVHAANVYISGGLITNTAGVTKKTYAYSGDLANGTTIANATIKITFSAHVFYAKIVAHLVESDDEVSTLSLECGGGNWSGGIPLAIAKGPQAIFGSTSTNPWDSATTTTTTEVSFKPTTNMAADGHYNVFIEYISQSSAGKVSKVTVGTTDVVTFNY